MRNDVAAWHGAKTRQRHSLPVTNIHRTRGSRRRRFKLKPAFLIYKGVGVHACLKRIVLVRVTLCLLKCKRWCVRVITGTHSNCSRCTDGGGCYHGKRFDRSVVFCANAVGRQGAKLTGVRRVYHRYNGFLAVNLQSQILPFHRINIGLCDK